MLVTLSTPLHMMETASKHKRRSATSSKCQAQKRITSHCDNIIVIASRFCGVGITSIGLLLCPIWRAVENTGLHIDDYMCSISLNRSSPKTLYSPL